jgi:hypothetical protein
MACLGVNYDVNGNVTDGCEQKQADDAATESNATSLGSIACFDGNGDTVSNSYSGSILSDTRIQALLDSTRQRAPLQGGGSSTQSEEPSARTTLSSPSA